MGTYVQKINSNYIAAYEVVPNSPLAQQLATIGAGAFKVVTLTTGANPVPDVSDPSTKIIYLTKDASAAILDPYTEWIYIEGTPSGTWQVIGTTSMDLDDYKKTQTATSVTGLGALKTITALSQNANGEISATASAIQSATTSQQGVVQLAGSIGDTVSSENNKAASEKAVRDAINALDSDATSPSGSNLQVKVVLKDGKVSAVSLPTNTTENRLNKVTTWSNSPTDSHYPSEKLVITSLKDKADKVTNATAGNFAGLDTYGNLTDSGSKASDFATSAQGTKADSAIQGVKLNGASAVLAPDSDKIVTIPDAVATGTTGATNGLMTAADKQKLDGIASGAEANVQSDWNQTTTTADDYIKNKPTLGTAAAKDVPSTGNASSTQVVMGNDTRLTDSRTPTSHSHGNITNTGVLQTTDVAIANGDKLVITDSSDGGTIARSSTAFDGSTTTTALTPAGTFETFYQKPSGGIGTSDLASGVTTSLGKADSAIQGVKVNNTALTPDSNKVVDIPLAATNSTSGPGTAGVVTLEMITI